MSKRATIGIIATQDPVSHDLCHSFYHTYLIYPQATLVRYGAAFLVEYARGWSATHRLLKREGLPLCVSKRATIGIIVAQDPVSYDLCHSFCHTYLIYPQATLVRYGAAFLMEHARGCGATPVVRLMGAAGMLWECLHSGIRHFILTKKHNAPKQAFYYRTFLAFVVRTWGKHVEQGLRLPTIKIVRVP